MANRNPPGYVSPEQGRRHQLTVRLEPTTFAAYAKAVARAGTTKQNPIEEFCANFAREHGVKIRSTRPRTKATTPKGPR